MARARQVAAGIGCWVAAFLFLRATLLYRQPELVPAVAALVAALYGALIVDEPWID